MPADFPEAYVLLGCIECEKHYHTSWRAVLRWTRRYGADELVQLRRRYLRMVAASQGEPHTHGGKLRKRGGGFDELRSGHPALEWMPVRRGRRSFQGEVWVHMRDDRPMLDLDDDSVRATSQPASLERWNVERCARVHATRRRMRIAEVFRPDAGCAYPVMADGSRIGHPV